MDALKRRVDALDRITGQAPIYVSKGITGPIVRIDLQAALDNHESTTINYVDTTINYDSTTILNFNATTINVTSGTWTFDSDTEITFNGYVELCGLMGWCYYTHAAKTTNIAELDITATATQKVIHRIPVNADIDLSSLKTPDITQPLVYALHNIGTNTLTLLHNDAGTGTANYLFMLPGGVDVTIGPDATAILWYDVVASEHKLLSIVDAGGAYTDEEAQDAVGAMVADTSTVDVTYTDATPELKWDVITQMSVTSDASGVKLVNDEATPTDGKWYGKVSGSKGWHAPTISLSEQDGTPSNSVSSIVIHQSYGLSISGTNEIRGVAATPSVMGMVTTTTQDFAGVKTFEDAIVCEDHAEFVNLGSAPTLSVTGGMVWCQSLGMRMGSASQYVVTDVSGGHFYPGIDDSATLGTSSFHWNEIYCTNATINTSAREKKTDIRDCTLGLDFIEMLRPASYVWKDGGKRPHHGFIADEVKLALDKFGEDSGMYTKDENGEGLRYTELLAPIVLAIQELSDKVEELEKRAKRRK